MSSAISELFEQNEIKNHLANEIEERLSQELIFALVGPVGSGVSTAAQHINSVLSDEFGYTIFAPIKPSDIIKSESHRVGLSIPDKKDLAQYIRTMQDAGNQLRERFGENYLAEKIIERIASLRGDDGGYVDVDKRKIMKPARRAFVIDSIKNNEEVNLLRKVYGGIVIMVGVFAPDEMRRDRLVYSGASRSEVDDILDRDQGEVPTFGQKTRKIFVEADFFICNDQTEHEVRLSIARFLKILFDVAIHTPTRAESVMYEAAASASKSACMSRQVGASIVSTDGELISIGWNDVPKFGGGLYDEDDATFWNKETQKSSDQDHRCWKWREKICHNETKRNKIIEKMIDSVVASKKLNKKVTREDVRKILAGSEIESITEYSRSIHAEMAAILAVAREGRNSIVGSTMYATTYPCHNCARHIVASGITRVIYIQPYKKSLALELHGDAITENPTEVGKVVFRQFEGVSPRMFLKMFNPLQDRKMNGKFLARNPKAALPIVRVPLDGASEYEAKVIADLANREQTLGGKTNLSTT